MPMYVNEILLEILIILVIFEHKSSVVRELLHPHLTGRQVKMGDNTKCAISNRNFAISHLGAFVVFVCFLFIEKNGTITDQNC